MKVLLVAERYWPEVGAAPSRLANMAEGLQQQGAQVDVLTSLPNYPQGRIFDGYRGRMSMEETVNGCKVFRYWIYATVSRNPIARIINMFSFALIIWMFALKRKRVKSYDRIIIQTPQLIVGASAMMLFKGLYGKKCLLNVSDIWPSTAVDLGAMKENSLSFRFMKKCELYIYRKCDGVLGQSQEILDHVAEEMRKLGLMPKDISKNDGSNVCSFSVESEKKVKLLFLYRNVQRYQIDYDHRVKAEPLKLVFSGMLGVAQDVAGIVKNIPFREMGVEFHILGGGKQLEEIQKWCEENPKGNVFTHGFVSKEKIAEYLREYHASIVPLVTHIRGAVPSKIYDILPQGLPILFCGGGEGAQFIMDRHVGLVSAPSDYEALKQNIVRLRNMSPIEYEQMSRQYIRISRSELDFDKQIKDCFNFLINDF